MSKNEDSRGSKHGSLHHIVPTSRGGPRGMKWNEYRWFIKKHQSWHRLFHNYMPSTCISIINDWTDDFGELLVCKIGERYLEDWNMVFDGWRPARAIKYIQEKFLPAEDIFLEQYKS